MIGSLAMAKAILCGLATLPAHHMRWRLMSRAPWNNVILSVRLERTLSIVKRSRVRLATQNAAPMEVPYFQAEMVPILRIFRRIMDSLEEIWLFRAFMNAIREKTWHQHLCRWLRYRVETRIICIVGNKCCSGFCD